MKALLLALLLAGCSTTVPVVSKWPDPPGQLVLEPCPNLQQLQESAKLSDVSKTVAVNYNTYYDCAVKHAAWVEWYKKQQIIYKDIK